MGLVGLCQLCVTKQLLPASNDSGYNGECRAQINALERMGTCPVTWRPLLPNLLSM